MQCKLQRGPCIYVDQEPKRFQFYNLIQRQVISYSSALPLKCRQLNYATCLLLTNMLTAFMLNAERQFEVVLCLSVIQRFQFRVGSSPCDRTVGPFAARHSFPTLGFLIRSATIHSVLLQKSSPKKVAAGVPSLATSNNIPDIPPFKPIEAERNVFTKQDE
jgi:hypothetical protein